MRKSVGQASYRAIAQLVARVVRDDEVVGSNPTGPTKKSFIRERFFLSPPIPAIIPHMHFDDSTHFDLIVIGGGASGLMAAGRAGSLGKRVLILEKNAECGKKLSISGGGRCNITNAEFDPQLLLANYGDAAKFLFSPFAQFGVQEAFDFFESRGLPLVIEGRKRAFPSTHSAPDVVRVLLDECAKHHVEIVNRCAVTKIHHANGHIESVETSQGTFTADSFVLATGGLSHPETGSTGDGFPWLKDLGHTVVTPTPSLVPLSVKEQWVRDLQGVTIKDIKISFTVDGVKAFNKKGSILFTHFGISGPTVLHCAQPVSILLQEGDVDAHLDLFPTLDEGSLNTAVLELFDGHKNMLIKNVWGGLLHAGILNRCLMLASISPETPVHSVTREERIRLVKILKKLSFPIDGLLGMDKAIVADGGVPLSEVSMTTMKSKKIDNLYLTGDLFHIVRPSGGYSLQLCWTTGFIAGSEG